jgi:serine/threonine protein kinase
MWRLVLGYVVFCRYTALPTLLPGKGYRVNVNVKPSTKLGAYELLERIAIGGMAEVYRGRAVGEGGFEKLVAIKRIVPHMARDERFVSMMVQEARIQAGLSHRNIVQIHDLGISDEGEYFIVLEYVDGRDLGALMAAMSKAAAPGNRMGDAVALHLTIEVAQGLQCAHESLGTDGQFAGLVHRDISPSNVLVSYAGEVKLSDFGLAKRQSDESVVGSLKGKLAYMSPEQARRWPLDQRTDIFALGAVLFELLTGRRLRDIEDESEGWRLVASGVMLSPRKARPDIPVVLERLLERALAPDAKDRFADVGAFVTAARQALELLPRARNGEASELQLVLRNFLPPGAPRTIGPVSRVIRLHSEFLDPSDRVVDMGATRPAVLSMRKRPATPPPPPQAAMDEGASRKSRPTLQGTPPVPLVPAPSAPIPAAMSAFPIGSVAAANGNSGARLTPKSATMAQPRRTPPGDMRVPADDLVPVAGELASPARQDRPVKAAPLALSLPSESSPRNTPRAPRAPGLTAPLAMVEQVSNAAIMRAGHVNALDAASATPRLEPASFTYPGATQPPVLIKPARHRWAGVFGIVCALTLAVHFLVIPLPVLFRWGQAAKLVVQSTPSGVHVTLDGQQLPQTTPTFINVHRDRKRHVLEFSKDGYEVVSHVVHFDHTVRLMVKATLPPIAGPSFQQLPTPLPVAAQPSTEAQAVPSTAIVPADTLVPAAAVAAVEKPTTVAARKAAALRKYRLAKAKAKLARSSARHAH